MKNLFILILFFLTSVLYCQELEFLSPSTDEEVAGIIPVKVKVISQDKNDIPLLQVIEATEETLNPIHPKVDFIEIPDPIIDTQDSKGSNFITTYVYKWDTCHVPTPLDKSIVNSHNGRHTLKLSLGDKSITENVTLNNLTIKVSPDKIFNLVNLGEPLPDNYEDVINIKPQKITVKVEGKNTDKPYTLTLNIYHKEAPFTGIRNKRGENLNKPIMTFILENVTGKTQNVIWKGESNFDKELIATQEENLKKEKLRLEYLKPVIDKSPESFNEKGEIIKEIPKELQEEYIILIKKYENETYTIIEPINTYTADEPIPSLIPGINYPHQSDRIDWNNYDPAKAYKNAKIIDVNQDILGKKDEFGRIINTPNKLYSYTDSLNGMASDFNKYKFNYSSIDWTDMANQYNFNGQLTVSKNYIGCDPGPYVVQAIITQNITSVETINNNEYKWETTDTNRTDSEYLFTGLYISDNGKYQYYLGWDEDEELDNEVEKLNQPLEDLEKFYEELMENIISEHEDTIEQLSKSNDPKDKENLQELTQELDKEYEKIEAELEEKLNELLTYEGNVHYYRLTDLKGNPASEIYNNANDYDHDLTSIYKVAYKFGEEQNFSGYEASPEGINHKVYVITEHPYDHSSFSCIENIAKDSDGMYYRDHENRWSL